MRDRSQWRERVSRIGSEPRDDYSHLTGDQRIALVRPYDIEDAEALERHRH